MAADVRAGLSRPFKELSPKLLLRRARLAALRADHRASRVLPDALRARDPGRAARRRSARPANNPATLIELGSGSAAKTRVLLDAMQSSRLPRHLRPGRHLRGDHPRHRREGRVASTTGSTSAAWSATSSSTSSGSEAGGPRVIALLGGTIGNFDPQQRRELPAPDRRPARPRRPLPARHRPGQGPRDASRPPTTTRPGSPRSSTRTCSRCSTASSAPTSTSTPSSTSPAGTPRTSGWTSACARSPTRSSTSRGARHGRPVRRRRGDAHRDLDQVHPPPASRRSTPRPASR